MGRLFQNQGDAARARDAFDAALAISEQQLRNDPRSVKWQRASIANRMARADVPADRENVTRDYLRTTLRERVRLQREDIGLLRGLAEADPSNADLQLTLGSQEIMLGLPLAALGQLGETPTENLAEALRWFQSARDRFERLARLDPERAVFAHHGGVHAAIAGALDAQGMRVEALKVRAEKYQQQDGWFRRQWQRHPESVRRQYALAKNHGFMGLYFQELAEASADREVNAAAAVRACQDEWALLEPLLRREPDNREWLGESLSNRGTLLRALTLQGKKAEMIAVAEEVQRLQRHLVQLGGVKPQGLTDTAPVRTSIWLIAYQLCSTQHILTGDRRALSAADMGWQVFGRPLNLASVLAEQGKDLEEAEQNARTAWPCTGAVRRSRPSLAGSWLCAARSTKGFL